MTQLQGQIVSNEIPIGLLQLTLGHILILFCDYDSKQTFDAMIMLSKLKWNCLTMGPRAIRAGKTTWQPSIKRPTSQPTHVACFDVRQWQCA